MLNMLGAVSSHPFGGRCSDFDHIRQTITVSFIATSTDQTAAHNPGLRPGEFAQVRLQGPY